MTRRSRDFDSDTEVQHDPLGYAPAATRPRALVRWTDPSGARELAIDTTTVAGASAGAQIVLTDATVSRLHAEFEPRNDGVWIQDLGSRNGTYVQGVQVVSARVPDGARIRLGGTTLSLHYAQVQQAIELWPANRFGPLFGESPGMRELFARIHRAAATDATVLIHGETGTGKELVAWALHEASQRARGPFVTVDCGALPEALLEAELFGHARGAFTGAVAHRAGAIESADGGTVFLDEIGELPLAMQPKLLRVLESRTVRRVGESQHRKVDVRFVSATHRDLRGMINAGAFREDLYFRLAVLPLSLPALRERPEDIPLLVESFLPPTARGAVSPELLHELMARPWPGNVRELRNFVERVVAFGAREALALSQGGARVSQPSIAPTGMPAVPLDLPFKEIREQWLNHLEREYIKGLLERHGGNVSAVAQAAGLARTYVHRLIRKYDL